MVVRVVEAEDLPRVVSRCPSNIRVRFTQYSRACRRSLFYVEAMQTIGAWHPYWGQRICVRCCSEKDRERLLAEWPDLLSWEPFDPEDLKSGLVKEMQQRQFRHAITDSPPPKVNGLRRLDGSEVVW